MPTQDAAIRFHAKRMHHEWKTIVERCKAGLLVFSPYLTSGVAEKVLGSQSVAQVHTVFTVELFASGASSLSTLRALLASGHELFHIPNLHAKVVLDGDGFVTVGSQNLTRGGTLNREITAAFHDEEAARTVRQLVAPWLEERVPITEAMIDHMESLIHPAVKLFAEAAAKAAELQRAFEEECARREPEERERQREVLDYLVRLALLQDEVERRRRSVEVAYTWVKRQESAGRVYSLVGLDNVDLTRWHVDGTAYDLRPFYRYLCVIENTGKLGWARVARTRITYVESSLVQHSVIARIPSEPGAALWQGQDAYTISLAGQPDPRRGAGANLRITMRLGGSIDACTIAAWYAPGTLKVLGVEMLNEEKIGRTQHSALREWLERPEQLTAVVVPEMTRPFKYEGNRTGQQANDFFGLKDAMTLRLFVENGDPVLVASRIKG